MSEERVDDGSFKTVRHFESDLGVRHTDESSCQDLVKAYHQKLDPSEYIDDEYTNRFEPVLSNLIHSEEEMSRYLAAIGIEDASGMVLYHVREILNDEQAGPDEDFIQDMDQIWAALNAKREELMEMMRKWSNHTIDEEDLSKVAQAYLLLLANGKIG